jgi:hypothetical protein
MIAMNWSKSCGGTSIAVVVRPRARPSTASRRGLLLARAFLDVRREIAAQPRHRRAERDHRG